MSSLLVMMMMIMASIVVVFQSDVAQGICLPPPPRQSVTYNVGDNPGWGLSKNNDLARWVNGKTFYKGDKLVFVYNSGTHNVYQVGQKEYNSCKAYASDRLWTSGHDKVTLDNTGMQYFICNYPGTCGNED